MSRQLQILLDTKSPVFFMTLRELESMTGNQAIDARLIGDILHNAHAVMRNIGLDPSDTTAEELYHALSSHEMNPEIFANTHYTGLVFDGQVISLNYQDIIKNRRRAFEARVRSGMKESLRQELIDRYQKHPRVDKERVNKMLNHAKVTEEKLDHNRDSDADSPYILAIGDIFTDAFITLGDETAKVIKEGDKEWLAVPFGSKPPYEKVDIVKSVGPSPNVAVSISRLGQRAGLMAWVGGDATGEEALEYLKQEKVGTDAMIVEQDKATSYWYVLCYKADRTMLVKSEKYRYEWSDPSKKPDWIYLAYLGEDSWPLHEDLLEYLERNPDVNFALQPGTFQFKWGMEKMAGLYRRSKIVMMNREEAMDVTGLPYDSVKDLANGLHELGPEIVVITDGPNGSYASDGQRLLTIPNYPDPAPPVERTGAGDAFSSTFVATIAAGESIESALAKSPINSMNVVQHVGAQKGLLSGTEIEKYLADAPEWYKVKEVKE